MKCVDCPFHKIVPDPDPHDSFNYDDEALVCKKSPNDDSEFGYYAVDVGLRPYQTKHVESPDWCPLPAIQRNEKIEKILRED